MSTDLRPTHYGIAHHPEKGRLKAISSPVPSGAIMVRLLEHDGRAYRQIWASVMPEVGYAERLVVAINGTLPTTPAAQLPTEEGSK